MAEWQEDVETGVILALAYAAANTAVVSSRPATGSSMDWTETASGEDAYGWTDLGVKFAADDFAFEDADGNDISVQPPTADQQVGIIRFGVKVPRLVRCTTYEAGAKVYALATNASDASGVHTFTAAHSTQRAIIIEIAGLGMHYFPCVEISARTPQGGVNTLLTQEVVMDVLAGSSVTAGYQFVQYQDA